MWTSSVEALGEVAIVAQNLNDRRVSIPPQPAREVIVPLICDSVGMVKAQELELCLSTADTLAAVGLESLSTDFQFRLVVRGVLTIPAEVLRGVLGKLGVRLLFLAPSTSLHSTIVSYLSAVSSSAKSAWSNFQIGEGFRPCFRAYDLLYN
jgi:hypothetical protein